MANPRSAAIPRGRAASRARALVLPPAIELEDHAGAAFVEDLVGRARDRDPDAWEALYRLAYPALLSFAARRVGQALADDVVSETIARAVASIDRYQPGRSFNGWLFGISRHVVGDFGRRGRRWARQPAEVAIPSEPGPGEALELDFEHRRMSLAFARLSARDRELLELRVVAGLSSEEVGALLGKSPEAVRTAQCRAIARLRAMVAEADD
ncbi:MAG: polymerase sigma-70 factor, subfamily [Acidimicrobiaceae bacterium]|jgi:RNA polymerase sigma-70 factor (ECF subfamily)|nr:polymerase sigma-70 factor, subfamily [Acidimicrobiaceae bacterium]